jgi:probable HAF family extracellular repeat protein
LKPTDSGIPRAGFDAKTKRRFTMRTILFRTSLAGMLAASALCAQSLSPAASAAPQYQITDLGTLGGTLTVAFGINNAGRIGGTAALPNGDTHAFLTGIGGTKYDLGTLGGPNAQASAPDGRENLPITSEISTPDPLKEDFCGFGDHLICLGALWNGVMRPLPTLGGNNAMALALNNRGQIVGTAENRTHDPSCPAPQILDFEPVAWGPAGDIQGLPPLPGDTVGFALGINDSGQIVGSSGNCTNTVVTAVGLLVGPHAVLWENGSVKDLGNLGGEMMGKAAAINNRGEVAGFSDVADGTVHSFLWTRETGMKDLGGLGTDVLGDPAGINNNTQVVGGSCDDSGNCRAFLWQNNVLSDLNSLIPADSPLYLVYALGISDAGEIVGFAVENSTGDLRAYLATPIPGKSGKQGDAPAARSVTSESRPAVLPDRIRLMLQQRLPFGRFGGRR